jgi:hypothetical protein
VSIPITKSIWRNAPSNAATKTTISSGPNIVFCSNGVGAIERKWPVLNLGLCFSNKCGVRLNLRRIDGFISMIILVVKPG